MNALKFISLYNKQTKPNNHTNRYGGFTIIELLIVIVIIGILVAIMSVAYMGIVRQAEETALKADLKQVYSQLNIINASDGAYPNDISGLEHSKSSTLSYTKGDNNTFCLIGKRDRGSVIGNVTQDGIIRSGSCPSTMQEVTVENCPLIRSVIADARDNKTYWIQKLSDGKCWTLTNLAYSGGGDNTNGDVKNISDGTSDSAGSYTVSKFYMPSGANPTVKPTSPAVSGDGREQYGYLYNWCAAMGNQQGTLACTDASAPPPEDNISICPAGWRLPTGDATTGELAIINDTLNSGYLTTASGLIAQPWMGRFSGGWNGGVFYNQGDRGYYWSSAYSSTTNARNMYFNNDSVFPSNSSAKNRGFAVRCVAF